MENFLIIIAGVLLVIFCVFLNYFVIPKLRFRNFPGPRSSSFLLGNNDLLVAARRGSMHEKLLSIAKEYGHTFQYFISYRRTVVVTHPDDVKLVLGTANYRKEMIFTNCFNAFVGENLLTIGKEYHKVHRRNISKVFNAQFLREVHGHMKPEMEVFVRKLKKHAENGVEIDADDMFVVMAADIMNRAGFSHLSGLQSNKSSLFSTGLRRGLMDMYDTMLRYPLGLHLPSGRKRIERFKSAVFPYVDAVLAQRKKQGTRRDLLDCFMNIPGFTDSQIRAETITFMTAGHDTTAHTLSWLLYEVCQRPDIERKMVEEIESLIGRYDPETDDEPSSFKMPTYDQVAKLEYCRQVWNETLRIHPVAATGPYRTCDRDTVLPGSGAFIPKGTPILVPIYILHKNEEYWPSPDTFDPERFSKEARRKRNPWTFIPFSAGQRNCIGQFFANFEAMVVIAVMFSRFKFRLNCSKDDVREFHSMTLRPMTRRPTDKADWMGIPVLVEKRY